MKFVAGEAADEAFAASVSAVIAPEDAELHFDLGVGYREMGVPDGAITEMGLVLLHAPEGANAERALSVVLEPRFLHGSVDEALVTLRELLFAN